jgi:segregation and condensation protein B
MESCGYMNLKDESPVNELVEIKNTSDLRNKVEAILFLTTEPVSSKEIAERIGTDTNLVRSAISQLLSEYETRDTALSIDTTKGYIMRVKDDYSDLSDEVLNFELKTSCLRTLSTIALKEPIYQKDLMELRGSNVYEHLKELEQLNLIKRKKEGNSNIVTTTSTFAEYFKLSNNGLELQHLLKNSEQNVKFVRASSESH